MTWNQYKKIVDKLFKKKGYTGNEKMFAIVSFLYNTEKYKIEKHEWGLFLKNDYKETL